MPRDYWTQVIDIELPQIVRFERPAAATGHRRQPAAVESAVPGHPERRRRGDRRAHRCLVELAERLDAPVCSAISTMTRFPGSHPLAGPLGYNGSKAAMELISKADVVLALGTRLNPFSTLPGYGIDYWPKDAKIIQVDINPDRIGLTKKVTVGIRAMPARWRVPSSRKLSDDGRRQGREGAASADRADQIRLGAGSCLSGSRGRRSRHHLERARAPPRADWMSPRMAWRAIQSALPKEAIISSDIGNNCAIGNAYPTFEAGPQIPRARPVRSLRLRPAVHRRRQDRPARCAGGRLSPATAPSASP
jgi:sulfoacetaldehyde acetyltransferase